MSTLITINECVAEVVFGWQWLSYLGIPIKGTPGYPAQCRVRLFCSPEKANHLLHGERFAGWRMRYECRLADKTEPLAYDYCSAGGSDEIVPDYSTSGDVFVLYHMREKYRPGPIWDAFVAKLSSPGEYKQGDYCLAALSVLATPIQDVFAEILADVPAEAIAKLPTDGADRHDFYINRQRNCP